jgi:copper chaperone CopZ
LKDSGLIIVRVDSDAGDMEDVRRRLSKLDCVTEVESNIVSRKLRITHDGSERCVKEIRKVLGSQGAGIKPRKSAAGHV